MAATCTSTVPMVDLPLLIARAEPLWRPELESLLRRGPFILGSHLRRFEAAFARAVGAPYAVGTASGTAALELALRAASLPAGGEVLTSALTSPFTAQAIFAAGLQPRFADIDEETLQISVESVAREISPRTVAVIAVHLYGQPCRIDELARLAHAKKLVLVQDACQAHGARFRGRPFTRFSPYVAYSFYPTKNLGALGDGGAVATTRAAISRKIAELRDGARRGGQVSYHPALNARLDEMQAVFLNAFLAHLESWNAERTRLAARYDELLDGCPGVRLVKRDADSVSHLYPIRAQRRDRLRQYLQTQGIATGIHYPRPLHLHPAFRRQPAPRLPVVESVCRQLVSLPLYPGMAEEAVQYVAATVWQFYRQEKEGR